MDDSERVKNILKSLLDLEKSDLWSLDLWNRISEEIYQIDKKSSVNLPEIVWHYLSDADIRHKEIGE